MRLGKEQAAGYVEDTSYADDIPAGSVPVEEVIMDQPQRMPLTPAPELVLPADSR